MKQIKAKVVIVDAYGVFNFGKGISENVITTFKQWLNEGKRVYVLSNTTDTISLGGGNNTIHLENNKEVDWFSRGKIYVSAIPETVDTIYGYDMWYREIVCINGGERQVYEIGNDTILSNTI